MGSFRYSAINKEGQLSFGAIAGVNEKEARDSLRSQGLTLTQMKRSRVFFEKSFDKNWLLPFTLQLKQLIDAGIPIYESLISLKEQSLGRVEHALLANICEKIRLGSSLSKAFSEYPNLFDERYIAMVVAGEMSGSLRESFCDLVTLLEKQNELKKQLVSALLYPALLGSICLVVISLLLFFVVPSIESLMDGNVTSGITAFVMQTSHFVRDYGWFLLCIMIFFASLIYWKKEVLVRSKRVHQFYLKIPLLKTVLIKSALVRFFRTLATLQKGGVSLVDSLEMSLKVMKCPSLEELMRVTRERIVEGSSLGKELSKSPLIPSLTARMLVIGEEAGSHLSSFEKIAGFYESDVEKLLQRFTMLLQPLILVVMGLIVGLVMLAILLPLTDVNVWIGDVG